MTNEELLYSYIRQNKNCQWDYLINHFWFTFGFSEITTTNLLTRLIVTGKICVDNDIITLIKQDKEKASKKFKQRYNNYKRINK